MPLNLPALPNFQTNIPQADPLQTYGKLLELKALQGQQALQPLKMQQAQQQVQSETLANQKAQMDIESQKALRDAVAGGVFNKYTGVETPDGSGFDAAGAYSELLSKHPNILPEQASAQIQSLQKIGQSMAELRKTNAQAAEANATVRGKTMDALAAKLGAIGDMPASKAGEALDSFHQDLARNPKAYPGLTQEELGHLYASDLGHLSAITQYMGLEGKMADFHKSKAEAAKAQQGVIPEGGGLSPEARQEAQKSVAVYNAETPGAIQRTAAEAQARQQAAQGSPDDAGKLLAGGQLTLADLKSRGTTPKYITQSVAAAQKINPNYNPADEVIAESVAKSQGANQFFGSANSLISKGGTLDQLTELSKKIPQHDFPVLNKVEDWEKLATGKGPLAGYAAMALGVADDYGKVMGGGTASDHARDAALQLFSKASSPEQRAQAIQATRGAVQSQRDSRIGNNQFLKRQYGAELGGQGETRQATQSAPPAGATHIVPGKDGKNHYTNAAGTMDLGIAP